MPRKPATDARMRQERYPEARKCLISHAMKMRGSLSRTPEAVFGPANACRAPRSFRGATEVKCHPGRLRCRRKKRIRTGAQSGREIKEGFRPVAVFSLGAPVAGRPSHWFQPPAHGGAAPSALEWFESTRSQANCAGAPRRRWQDPHGRRFLRTACHGDHRATKRPLTSNLTATVGASASTTRRTWHFRSSPSSSRYTVSSPRGKPTPLTPLMSKSCGDRRRLVSRGVARISTRE